MWDGKVVMAEFSMKSSFSMYSNWVDALKIPSCETIGRTEGLKETTTPVSNGNDRLMAPLKSIWTLHCTQVFNIFQYAWQEGPVVSLWMSRFGKQKRWVCVRLSHGLKICRCKEKQ